jgi:hypothetical protein
MFGYTSAPIVIGHRYECEQCGKRIWLFAGSGITIYTGLAIWVSGMWLTIHEDPTGLALTAVVFGAIGAREAWLRHRYPSAA